MSGAVEKRETSNGRTLTIDPFRIIKSSLKGRSGQRRSEVDLGVWGYGTVG